MNEEVVFIFLIVCLIGGTALWGFIKMCPRKENETEEEELPPEASAPVSDDVEDPVTVNNAFYAEETGQSGFAELPPAYEDLFDKNENN